MLYQADIGDEVKLRGRAYGSVICRNRINLVELLFKEIGMSLDDRQAIYCDNLQII